MPNIGQGCGLAFEDGYVLAKRLGAVERRSDVPASLEGFYRERILRTAAVQGLGRMNSEVGGLQVEGPQVEGPQVEGPQVEGPQVDPRLTLG